jgi:hypothetical protein
MERIEGKGEGGRRLEGKEINANENGGKHGMEGRGGG